MTSMGMKSESGYAALHSIVIPVYNSNATLGILVDRIYGAMSKAGIINFELILVDDGSLDGSFDVIRKLSSRVPFVRGIRLSRNFGHQAALTIGLRESRGEYTGIIDDDLQDPPELLPQLFAGLYEGADVVYGIRQKRKESWLKKIAFKGFYRVLNTLSKINIPQDTGDFCVMRKCVVSAILELYDANPFLRGTRAWLGFRQIGIKYERSARKGGKSGYTLSKYMSLAVNGILMFSNFPLRLSIYLGLVASSLATIYSFTAIVIWLVRPFDVPGYLSLVVLVTFLGGVQLISIGILGEYIGRLIDNTRKWPVALIAEKVGENQ